MINLKNVFKIFELPPSKLSLCILTILLLGITLLRNTTTTNFQHFSFLSQSFLQGKTYFLNPKDFPNTVDLVPFNNHFYWHLGPFPAILMIPFVLLLDYTHLFPLQGYANMILFACNLLLAYKLSRHWNFNKSDSLWLSLAFCYGSIVILATLQPWSWYFSQNLTILLSLASLYEFFNKKRYYLIGILLGLNLLTRNTLILSSIFFILEILSNQSTTHKQKLGYFLKLTFPLICAISIFAGYNFIRFHNINETGYQNSLRPQIFQDKVNKYGLINIRNIPENFYYFFLKPPEIHLENAQKLLPVIFASPEGMSFFLVSPLFIQAFAFKPKKLLHVLLWASIIPLSLLSLSSSFNGATTYGPRYLLDIMPFLFILLLESFKQKQLKPIHLGIITFSIALNLYFLTSMYGYEILLH